jgi:hypothetical protein
VLVFALFFLFMFRYPLYFLLDREANVEGRKQGEHQRRCCSCHSQARGPILEMRVIMVMQVAFDNPQRRVISVFSVGGQPRPQPNSRIIPGELQDTRPSDIACRGLAPHRPGGAGPCTRPHPIYVPGRWDFLFSPGRSASLAVRILVGRGEIVFAWIDGGDSSVCTAL